MKKIIFSILTFSVCVLPMLATNPVSTSMPALTIAPDARSAGMGDVGVATSADIHSQHWNPAKYAFINKVGGFSINYTPWLTSLGVDDINLAYVAGYYNMGDQKGALSASLNFFSMGEVQRINMYGEQFGDIVRPREWSLDVAYSRKLHEYVSMAVALRFLCSDLYNGQSDGGTDYKAAMTAAADVALYYRQPISLPMGESYLSAGLNLSNLGGKMTYDEITQHFIPANMRLGIAYELPFNSYNKITATVECNKMLVPTSYSKYGTDTLNGLPYMGISEYSEISSPKGWFMSFNDAPGYTDPNTLKEVSPLMEEFQEVQWGVGLEYAYNNMFFVRAGYSHENFWKGNRRYATLGVGFHYSMLELDLSYCIGNQQNPLNNTVRVSLALDLNEIKTMINNKKQ